MRYNLSYSKNLKSPLYFPVVSLLMALAIMLVPAAYLKTPLEGLANVTASPSFSLKEITDESFDWLDFWRGKQYGEGPSYIDIESVNYFSNGRFLNATIWFPKPSLSNSSLAIPPNDSAIDYGMYIDADFDNKTGVEGIDYKVEIKWDNKTREWNRVVEEWATNTNAKVLSVEDNYTDISENEGYVSISADMSKLTSPVKYKVIFYAQEIKGKIWTVDHTEWIYVPPPEFSITTLPRSAELRAGENSTIEVSVKSVEGFEPVVFLYTVDQPTGIKLDFKYERLKIPSYGTASTPLIVSTMPNASQQPYTLNIFANFTFPNEKFITPLLQAKSQSLDEQTSLTIIIDRPTTITDQISDFWQKLGSPINFVYVVAAALAPFIYALVKKRLERNKPRVKEANHTTN